MSTLHRAMWMFVVVLGEVTGFIAGLSFGLLDFWLTPGAGLFAMTCVIVLAVTVSKLSKREE